MRQKNQTGRPERESGELTGEFMEWNATERAIKTEIDTRTEWKRSGQARLVYVFDINHKIPTVWRWAREDLKRLKQKVQITDFLFKTPCWIYIEFRQLFSQCTVQLNTRGACLRSPGPTSKGVNGMRLAGNNTWCYVHTSYDGFSVQIFTGGIIFSRFHILWTEHFKLRILS